MSNLYHEDIYKFNEPVKSYWESTSDTNNKYKKLEKNIQTNIVVIGGGYTGISCALSLAKNYNEDVVLVEVWTYWMGIICKKCWILLYLSSKNVC